MNNKNCLIQIIKNINITKYELDYNFLNNRNRNFNIEQKINKLIIFSKKNKDKFISNDIYVSYLIKSWITAIFLYSNNQKELKLYLCNELNRKNIISKKLKQNGGIIIETFLYSKLSSITFNGFILYIFSTIGYIGFIKIFITSLLEICFTQIDYSKIKKNDKIKINKIKKKLGYNLNSINKLNEDNVDEILNYQNKIINIKNIPVKNENNKNDIYELIDDYRFISIFFNESVETFKFLCISIINKILLPISYIGFLFNIVYNVLLLNGINDFILSIYLIFKKYIKNNMIKTMKEKNNLINNLKNKIISYFNILLKSENEYNLSVNKIKKFLRFLNYINKYINQNNNLKLPQTIKLIIKKYNNNFFNIIIRKIDGKYLLLRNNKILINN